MIRRHCSPCLIASLVLVRTLVFADGFLVGGRDYDENRDAQLRITAGMVTEIEAMVQETTRRYYDASDQQFKQDLAERFGLDDFNLDDGYLSVGLSYENAAKWLTFKFDAHMSQADAEAVAQRNYYIGVGSVEYNGREYDHMKIPEGRAFSMDLTAFYMEMRGMFTPFTFKPDEGVRFTPWIDIGLIVFAGSYDIDAGRAEGVTQYQNPPEDFVVGGQADGTVGLGLPEFGIGGELRIGDPGMANLVLKAHYAILEYDGGTSYFTSSQHREKNIDIDHFNAKVSCGLEVPRPSGRCVTLALQYQLIESEAAITSQEGTTEEIIARRERFDKDVDFRMGTATAMLGLTF
jgi:hypothetical protein